jgi:hypothetical protein
MCYPLVWYQQEPTMPAKPTHDPIALFWTVIAGAFTYAILGTTAYGVIKLAIELISGG